MNTKMQNKSLLTVYATSNDQAFSCLIIYTDTIHNAILFTDTHEMLDTMQSILTPYFAIIISNDFSQLNLLHAKCSHVSPH